MSWRLRSFEMNSPRTSLRLPSRYAGCGQGIVGINPESMIRRSCVRRAAPKVLAEATRTRSAGSRWKLSGRAATSEAMEGVIETSWTSGGATACASQSRRGRSSSTPPETVQSGNLPKSDPGDQERRLRIGFRQNRLLPRRKSRVLLEPPEQNMGIEQSFQSSPLSASQASAGSTGSTTSPTTLTVPKRAC